ncbi:unnamed protein product, partial [Amoebophrya sp. A25]
ACSTGDVLLHALNAIDIDGAELKFDKQKEHRRKRYSQKSTELRDISLRRGVFKVKMDCGDAATTTGRLSPPAPRRLRKEDLAAD